MQLQAGGPAANYWFPPSGLNRLFVPGITRLLPASQGPGLLLALPGAYHTLWPPSQHCALLRLLFLLLPGPVLPGPQPLHDRVVEHLLQVVLGEGA